MDSAVSRYSALHCIAARGGADSALDRQMLQALEEVRSAKAEAAAQEAREATELAKAQAPWYDRSAWEEVEPEEVADGSVPRVRSCPRSGRTGHVGAPSTG